MFPACICANNIGSVVHNLFGVKNFNFVPDFFLFRGFNFTLSAIVSSEANHIDNGDDDDPRLDICFVGVLCLYLSKKSSKNFN